MTRVQKLIGATALIATYFLALTWRGLTAYFTGDDLTNIQFLHGFGQRSLAMLLVHTAVVVTPEYRPFGGVVYRILFATFGLDPVPFRVFCYLCLLLNLSLAWLLVRNVARSATTATLSALICAVNACMGGLYFNTGTLYDILCFTCGISALIVYVRVRSHDADLNGRHLAVFLALYCLALDSKEMAVAWPALLAAYEIVFHCHLNRWRARSIPIAVAAVIAILYGLVKTQVPNQMSITPDYVPRMSLAYAGQQLNHYYSILLRNMVIDTGYLLVCLAFLLLVGILLRSRPMVFGILFANIALLPLLVIPGRFGFVWYIPWLGWSLYAGAFLARVIDLSAQRFGGGDISVCRRRETAASWCFVVLVVGLYAGQRDAAAHMGDSLLPQQHGLRALADALTRANPNLQSGSRVLVADDQLPSVEWTQLFLIRLAWRDATLWVDRPSQLGGSFDTTDLSEYAVVIHAGAVPIRVLPGVPISRNPWTRIAITPQSVNRSRQVSVEVPGFPSCRLDVEYRLPDDELARSGIWKNWCTLDADGRCHPTITQDAERGVVQVRRIRLCDGEWRRTQASFEILP